MHIRRLTVPKGAPQTCSDCKSIIFEEDVFVSIVMNAVLTFLCLKCATKLYTDIGEILEYV